MPTFLGDKYPPLPSRRPPHMSEEDYEIWRRWWPRQTSGVVCCYFDVYVGRGADGFLVGDPADAYERGWIRNNQKRIDQIAVFPAGIWIIELRHFATANAVGRLLQYKQLYLEDPVLGSEVALILVSNHQDKELSNLCRSVLISYHVV